MSLPVEIIGKDAKGHDEIRANVHSPPFRDAGLVVYTENLVDENPEVHPFLNETFGGDMAQNVTFGGNPELITDGTDNAGWTGVAIAGAWDFSDLVNPYADSNCVSLTSANDLDQASFTDATETTMSGFTAVTGQIRLEVYTDANHTIELQFYNNSSPIGNSVDIDDQIDTTLLGAYQGFAFPKSDFGLTDQVVDEVIMLVHRAGGSKPTFRFDVFQIEETGTPALFKAGTRLGTRFHTRDLILRMAAPLDTTLLNATQPNMAYDDFLGLTLALGVTFSRVQNGETAFSASVSTLSDLVAGGGTLENQMSDGTNTFLSVRIPFVTPAIIEGDLNGNFISMQINDNMSTMVQFSAVARGGLEDLNI